MLPRKRAPNGVAEVTCSRLCTRPRYHLIMLLSSETPRSRVLGYHVVAANHVLRALKRRVNAISASILSEACCTLSEVTSQVPGRHGHSSGPFQGIARGQTGCTQAIRCR